MIEFIIVVVFLLLLAPVLFIGVLILGWLAWPFMWLYMGITTGKWDWE